MYGLETFGLQELQRELAALSGSLSNLRGLWQGLARRFRGWVGDQFASQGAWGGLGWAPLSPRYAALKASRFPGRSILIASGELARAAERPRPRASARTLTLEIDSPIFRFHQRGTQTMPARPLIPASLPMQGELEVAQEMLAYVRDRVARGGLLA